jgi:hypothetical protein
VLGTAEFDGLELGIVLGAAESDGWKLTLGVMLGAADSDGVELGVVLGVVLGTTDSDGVELGVVLGIVLGTTDSDGVKLGIVLGGALGLGVGILLGFELGPVLGIMLCVLLGCIEGSMLGAAEGDGSVAGTTVGFELTLGCELGVSLGCIEGSVLGPVEGDGPAPLGFALGVLDGIGLLDGISLGFELGSLVGVLLGFELGVLDGLLLRDGLMDGPALGSLLGMPERLGWVVNIRDGALLGAVTVGSTGASEDDFFPFFPKLFFLLVFFSDFSDVSDFPFFPKLFFLLDFLLALGSASETGGAMQLSKPLSGKIASKTVPVILSLAHTSSTPMSASHSISRPVVPSSQSAAWLQLQAWPSTKN